MSILSLSDFLSLGCVARHAACTAVFLSMILSIPLARADQDQPATAAPDKPEGLPDDEEHPPGLARPKPGAGGIRSSLIEGEETFEPLERPLSEVEAEKLEAKKLLVVGYMQLDQRELNQALHTFETALKHDPNSPAILRELAALCLQLERGAEAVEYCRRALALAPNDYELWHAYGLKLEEDRNIDGAIEALERASKVEGIAKKDPGTFFEIRLKLADMQDLRGNHAAAADAMRDVVDYVDHPERYATDPQLTRQIERNRTVLYRKYASALKNAKRFDEAIAALERGRASGDGGQVLAGELADVYFQTGDYSRALTELEAYLRVPDDRGLALLERTLDKLGRREELITRLGAMVERDPENPSLRRFYGEKLLDAGQFEKAREQLLKVRTRPESLPLLARLFREMNRPRELLDAFTESMTTPNGQEALPPQIKALAQDKQFLGEVAKAARELKDDQSREVPRFFADYIVARAAREAKEVDLGKEFYERCIEERPEASPLYLELVELLWTNQRFAELVEVCGRAIDKKVPGEFDFFEYQARGLEMQGKTEQAVEVIDKLIARLGDGDAVVEANVVLAWIYQHAEKWDKAEEVCNRVITEFPGVRRVPYVRYLLSNVYTLSGDQRKSEEQLLLLLEADPQAVPREIIAAANNDLGYLWADEGRKLDEAEKMVRRALEINPDSAAYLDSLGWVLFKSGKYAEAVEYLNRATQAETGEDAVIWDHLGDAYRKLDDLTQARKAWEKAVELYKKDSRERDRAKAEEVARKIEFVDNPDAPPPERAKPGDP